MSYRLNAAILLGGHLEYILFLQICKEILMHTVRLLKGNSNTVARGNRTLWHGGNGTLAQRNDFSSGSLDRTQQYSMINQWVRLYEYPACLFSDKDNLLGCSLVRLIPTVASICYHPTLHYVVPPPKCLCVPQGYNAFAISVLSRVVSMPLGSQKAW